MVSGFSLEENHSLKGKWWLPSRARRKVPGVLSLKARDGVYVELEGSLGDSLSGPTLSKYPIILGETHAGQNVTLWNCQKTRWSLSGQSELYRADVAFVGRHFNSETSIKLSAAYVWLYNSDEWLRRTGFVLPKDFSYDDLTIRYSRPAEIEFHTSTTTQVSVGFSVEGPKYMGVQKSVELSQCAYFKIRRTRKSSIKDYLSTITAIQYFLALAIRGTVYPVKMQVTYRDEVRNSIYVYYPLVPRPGIKPKPPSDMVFSFPDVSDEIRQLLDHWLGNWSRLRPMCDIYFGTVHGRESYLDYKFLAMTQILESFHRRFVGGQYQTEREYLADVYPGLIDAIPSTIRKDYRTSLKAKMRYMYEYSFRKRVHDVIRRSPKRVIDLLLGQSAGARDQFLTRVVDTRNYYTHYTRELEPKAARGPELYWLFNKMKILSEIMFLREMGLGLPEIERFMTRNHQYLGEFELGRASS